MMKNSLKDKFPKWFEDLDPSKHYLVMSDDYDSYFSCRVLMDLFKLEIGGFFQFTTGLWLNKERTDNKQPVYVDLSIAKGMTFDNHMTFIKNPLAINPNIITTNYFRKYNGSTLALICSLYDYDIDNIKRLTTLLCIDGWYCGYYNANGAYRHVNVDWYEKFGMEDKLLPILKANSEDYFKNHVEKYNINAKISMTNNKLHCDTNIPLPDCSYKLALPVRRYTTNKEQVQSIYEEDPDCIITSAETYKNRYCYSRKDNRCDEI